MHGKSAEANALGNIAKSGMPDAVAGVKRVSLLGVDGDLKWQVASAGMTIEVPKKQPCEHAFSFKIEYDGRLPWHYDQ